jgi:serine/threonine protein kinase
MINHSELLPEGREIGGFKIEKAIGNGNMGIIYRAIQINLNRPVALKVLFKTVAEDQDFVRSFFREAQAAAAFTHQNIVQAFDVGQTDDGIYYFAMELIEGGDISQQLKIRGTYTPIEALKYMVDIADGLDYGSTLRKLTHGDIKPANIMITKAGKPKLADLGLARMGGEIQGESDGIMLTPLYAAPEMIDGTWVVGDPRADMYSVGATLYHMISGHPPFFDDDYNKVIQMQLKEKHVPLTAIDNPTPSGVSKLVDKFLEKKPERRFKDWKEAKAAIEHALKEPSEPSVKKKKKVLHYHDSEQSSPTSHSASQSRKKKKSNTPIMALIAVVLILVVGFAFMLSMKKGLAGDDYAHVKKEFTGLSPEKIIKKIEFFVKNKGTTPPEAAADLKKYRKLLASRSLFSTSSLSKQKKIIDTLEKDMKKKPRETTSYINSKYRLIERDLNSKLNTYSLGLHIPFDGTYANHSSFSNPTKPKIIKGSESFSTSSLNKAMNFSGQSLILGNVYGTRFTQNSQFSIAFWLKSGAESSAILGKYDFKAGSISTGYRIVLHKKKIRVELIGSPDNKLIAISQQALKTNSWEHVTILYKNKTVTMYLNGNKIPMETNSNLTKNFSSSGSFVVGFQDSKIAVDDLRIWSRTLIPKEVSELFKNRKKSELETLVRRYQDLKQLATKAKRTTGPNKGPRSDAPSEKVTQLLGLLTENFGNWRGTIVRTKPEMDKLIEDNKENPYLKAIGRVAPSAKRGFIRAISENSNLQKLKGEKVTSGSLNNCYFIRADLTKAIFEKKLPIGIIEEIYYWDENRSKDAAAAIISLMIKNDLLTTKAENLFLAALILPEEEVNKLASKIENEYIAEFLRRLVRDRKQL